MYLDSMTQKGLGLPFALFVITVLALIVVVMAQLQVGSAESLSLQLQSQRAFLAAESGAQLGVSQVLTGGCGGVSASVPSAGTFGATGLMGCRATLACSAGAAVVGPSGNEQYFLVTSTGTCPTGDGGQVRRVVEVRLR